MRRTEPFSKNGAGQWEAGRTKELKAHKKATIGGEIGMGNLQSM
jgi:hypothetical protein